MKFITYAQNFEDVILYRALKNVEQGFYIDIGAQSPVIDSVTRAFYERGWRGINIDASPHWINQLDNDRPEDVNLCLAVGEKSGEATFYDVHGTGLSTTDPELGLAYKNNPELHVEEYSTRIQSLSVICETYRVSVCHFLKIDVEGAEESVIRGADFTRFRPWIIVIESTRPQSTEESFRSWEPRILDAGYSFAYFDGLNRFYTANEKPELAALISTPPNPFDDFEPFRQYQLTQEIENLKSTIGQKNRLLDEREEQLHETLDKLEGEIQHRAAIYASLSWRFTAPLRATFDMARASKYSASIQAFTQKSMSKAVSYVLKNPRLTRLILSNLRHFPRAYAWLQSRYGAAQNSESIQNVYWQPPHEKQHLNLHAKQILESIKMSDGQLK